MPVPSEQGLNAPKHVAAPTLSSVTTNGATGSTHYGYKIVGKDADGNHTAASAEVVATDGNAALGGSKFEALAWTDPVGASTVDIYRTTGGATQGLIGSVAAGVQAFNDNGIVADGATAPSTDTSGLGNGAFVALDIPYVWITGTFVATAQVQASLDGTSWVNVGSALTAPGFVELPTCLQTRIKTTAYTSGTVVATLVQRRL